MPRERRNKVNRRRARIIRLPPDAILTSPERSRRPETDGPICVRRTVRGYELTAGERSLRNAQAAGLGEVSCLLAAEETMQADYLSEAEALQRLIGTPGISQAEAARRMGKSQSAVANKLRILRQPPEILAALRETGLSERHARALLRVEDPMERLRVLRRAAAEGWRVAQLEAYLASLPPGGSLREARQLLHTAEEERRNVCCCREETESEIVLTIRVAK